ncbi:unnamed protein product [Anisakis simplex]|uniref:MELPH protein n=1 Tax=Anisakis simplex TaxID=6269 RepID=A0A0M3K5P9_ANISI|nr:unnamed protein product [Anisakis simplex]
MDLRFSIPKHSRKKEEATQDERTDKKDECISFDKVTKLGNLDDIREKRKAEIEREIESMQSEHEMATDQLEEHAQPSTKHKHVTITESKCKLYETNDEPTLDEEEEEQALLLLNNL